MVQQRGLLVLLLVVCFGCASRTSQPYPAKECRINKERVNILNAFDRKHLHLVHDRPMELGIREVKQAERVLCGFIPWHNDLGPAQRDSLFTASGHRIRPECLLRGWTNEYRQYLGERDVNGDLIVRISSCCRRWEGMDEQWIDVNDGGSCFFQAEVNLTTRQVVGYRINGPYRPGGCQ